MEEKKNFENPESLELVYKGTNGQALTTSLMVAKKFGKEHKHVLDAIRNLLNTTAEKSAFVDSQQLTKKNKNNFKNITFLAFFLEGFLKFLKKTVSLSSKKRGSQIANLF